MKLNSMFHTGISSKPSPGEISGNAIPVLKVLEVALILNLNIATINYNNSYPQVHVCYNTECTTMNYAFSNDVILVHSVNELICALSQSVKLVIGCTKEV